MKLKLLLVILVLGVAGCDRFEFDIPEPDAHLRQQVIFSARSAEEQNLGIVTGESVDSYWTPSEFDVNAMFVALIQHLQATGETEIRENYDTYQHQHFGYVVDGRQYIYGNYFCNDFGMDWQSSFISVNDGGDCFFQAIYDISANEIIELFINGEA